MGIGLFASILTGIGDFLLGYAEEIPAAAIAASVMVCAPIGAIPALILGMHAAIGAAIGTMFLSFRNAFTFGGLLATLPDQGPFGRFQKNRQIRKEGA